MNIVYPVMYTVNCILYTVYRVLLLSTVSCLLYTVYGLQSVTLLHLDLLLLLVAEAGLLLAHHGLGHLSVQSEIVLWYKRPVSAGSLKQH